MPIRFATEFLRKPGSDRSSIYSPGTFRIGRLCKGSRFQARSLMAQEPADIGQDPGRCEKTSQLQAELRGGFPLLKIRFRRDFAPKQFVQWLQCARFPGTHQLQLSADEKCCYVRCRWHSSGSVDKQIPRGTNARHCEGPSNFSNRVLGE